MKTNLERLINEYQRAGENVKVAAQVQLLDGKLELTVEESRRLRDVLFQGQVEGARAERAILNIEAVTVLRDKLTK